MGKFEVSITSRDTIKPSVGSSSLLHPYKLSIIDQLTPMMYFPVIFFYPITDPDFNLPQTLANLKEAISQTLTLYYPLSGRIKSNLFIDDFESGVPYLEARVSCHMIDFLRLPKLECLNEFVPTNVYRKETMSELPPLLGVQVNIFDSGIAIGVSFCHKVSDGLTADCFLKTWVAFFRGCHDKIIHPNLSEAALLFPPRDDDLPEKYVATMERCWFGDSEVVTRRFLFDAKAISALQDAGKSEYVPKPSRVQALTAFLWKHKLATSHASSSATIASWTQLASEEKLMKIFISTFSSCIASELGTSTTACIASQAVGFRSRMNKKTTLDTTIGNLFWQGPTLLDLDYTAAEGNDHNICDLVTLLDESLKEFNSDYLEILKGKEGYGGMCALIDMMGEANTLKPVPEIYSFSSWTSFFNQVDFGWGRPSWIGVTGKVETRITNFTIFIETQCDNGIEAWVTLDRNQMAVLEQDPKFLAFATPNPGISVASLVDI